MSTPVILDCDPGHDDALAILLAAGSPAIRLLAITTVAGNQTLERTTLNARRVCSAAGIEEIPIAAGCDQPLRRPQIVATAIHGESGLEGPAFGDPTVEPDPRHAVDLIVELGMAGGLTLVATAPLTNVATALRREPALARRLERVVVMGGAAGLGNWTPSAEFNIYADPEAAQVVLDSGVPVTLVPLEVTHRALATPDRMARIAALDGLVARLAVELIAYFEEKYRRVFGFPHPPIHDACAVAAVIDAAVVRTERVNVVVDLGSDLSLGRTVCDLYRMTGRRPNADLGIDLDVERFWELLTDALATYR